MTWLGNIADKDSKIRDAVLAKKKQDRDDDTVTEAEQINMDLVLALMEDEDFHYYHHMERSHMEFSKIESVVGIA